MMLGAHSKMFFSLFVASDIKKTIENEQLKCQYGAKSVGAETVTRVFQQARAQNPSYDIFSADVCWQGIVYSSILSYEAQ